MSCFVKIQNDNFKVHGVFINASAQEKYNFDDVKTSKSLNEY